MVDEKTIKTIREKGFSVTPQRLAVIDFLKDNTSHPTADDVFENIKTNFPSMSFSTVYNTLHMMSELKLISEKQIIGWFQEKMEWGPRALGSRSILADPREVNMKDILNEKIKHRERFRPFDPG